ncbi:hypothetical protein PIB30_032240, partial [Stylosanthes scabra]|nr:hypothetical protein [Stylosanthes scabra]
LSLEMERKRAVAAEGQAGSLAASLKTCQADLSKATEASDYWRSEWHTLGSEVTDMCQETLDICLDQVSHLCPGVGFSAITLKSRWDPNGRRIFVPQESEVEGSFRLPRRLCWSGILSPPLKPYSRRLATRRERQQESVGDAPLKLL